MIERKEVEEQIRKYFSEEMSTDPEEINTGTLLVENLGCDSLDLAEMVMELEDRFDVSITDEEAKATKTVGQVIDLIYGHLNSGSQE